MLLLARTVQMALFEVSLNCGALCLKLFNVDLYLNSRNYALSTVRCADSPTYTQQLVDLPDCFLSSIKQSQIPIEK